MKKELSVNSKRNSDPKPEGTQIVLTDTENSQISLVELNRNENCENWLS